MRAGAARADVVGARIAVVRARPRPGREDAATRGIARVDGALPPVIADARAPRLASCCGVAGVADRALVVVAARGARGGRRVRLAAPDRIADVEGAGIAVAAVERTAEETDARPTLLVAVADVTVRA